MILADDPVEYQPVGRKWRRILADHAIQRRPTSALPKTADGRPDSDVAADGVVVRQKLVLAEENDENRHLVKNLESISLEPTTKKNVLTFSGKRS